MIDQEGDLKIINLKICRKNEPPEIYEFVELKELAHLRAQLKEAREIIDTKHPDEICVVDQMEKCMLGKKKCPNCRRREWLEKNKEVKG